MLTLASTTLFAFAVAAASLLLLYHYRGLFAQDIPNQRSLHQTPTPRLGGIGIFAGLAAAYGGENALKAFPPDLLLASCLLFSIAVIDDLRGVGVWIKFLTQILITFIALPAFGFGSVATVLATGLVIISVTNFFNFMDGSNGLAGGMAVSGFSTLALASVSSDNSGSHDIALATLSAAVASASFAFLFFNFGRARLFMGDAGSTVLGFLAASLGILGVQRGLWPFWFPVIVFSPFIVDATATLIKRGVRGEKIWQAHRSHYYQRVILMGWSHMRLALSEYTLMAVCAGAALLALRNPGTRPLIFSGLALLYIALMTIVDYHWSKHLRKAGAHV